MPFARRQPPSTIAGDVHAARPAARRPAGRRARSRRARSSAPSSTLRRAASTRLGSRRRPQDGELGGDRLRELPAPSGRDRPAAATACTSRSSPRPASTSSTRRRSRWSGVSAPNISRRAGSVNGTSSSRLRATSSITSTSRVTSRARQVGRDDLARPRCSKPTRSSQPICSSAGSSMPISSSARSGPVADHGPLREPLVHVGVADPARARGLDEQLRWRASPPARPGTGRRLSPSGSSPRCAGAGARRCGRSPVGSKFAASSSTSVVDSPISVSSPPMIPASATERSASAIIRSVGSSFRSTPSSVRIVSPGARAADDDLAALERRQVERVQRVPEREHHVVRHVDDVRDRAHAGAHAAAPCSQTGDGPTSRRGRARPM